MNFAAYQTEAYYDELFLEAGTARPGAALFSDLINSLPTGELVRRQKAAEAALLQMGITFAVYGDKSGTEKIFPFDIIPRIIEAAECENLELFLNQSIEALNLFTQDIYNGQKIVKDKIIPEELIATAKTFRPQLVGFTPPKGIWCHITGTDLVRDTDGQFYVLEDNLRCPSGVSYVMENRELLKRTFPRVFEACRVRPVDDYPNQLLQTLGHLAPDGVDNPAIVTLTPGMYNSAYFEHSFLSQQMGIGLVEGRDLVVNDGYVMMRTTTGFKRADVIYRRIDDDFLDPKAFRPDSLLGVPGIMEAYKAGRIALANAPGSGIADDKVIYAYVPKIIQYYLGQEALLPNVPTYVCADDKERQHVLQNLDKMVVKAANESGGYGMLVGPHSTKESRADFAVKINASPRNYIAQPMVSLSRVPVIVEDHFEGRHVDLRPYILYGKRYLGAARRADARGIEEGFYCGKFQPGRRLERYVGVGQIMLSRVADSLYWMNRYIERAENIARFIHVNLHLQLDLPNGGGNQWHPLIRTTGDEKLFAERCGTATQDNVIHFLTFDQENPNSVVSCLRSARENARSIRETISSEMWQQLNSFYLKVHRPSAAADAGDAPHEFFTSIINNTHLFDGKTHATMSHNEGWHFGRLGKMMERADKTSRILDVKYYILLPQIEYVGMPFDTIQWAALLKSASALEMYRQRYNNITPSTVSQFLLQDAQFPRSILYCLNTASNSLQAITTENGLPSCPAQYQIAALSRSIADANIKDVIHGGLHEYLDDLQTRVNAIDDAIYQTFLSVRNPTEETIPPTPPPTPSQGQ